MNFESITWLTSFNSVYFESVAKYNLPTWKYLKGKKIAMVENMPGFKYDGIEIIAASPAYPKKDIHWNISGKKHKFWKKGKNVPQMSF